MNRTLHVLVQADSKDEAIEEADEFLERLSQEDSVDGWESSEFKAMRLHSKRAQEELSEAFAAVREDFMHHIEIVRHKLNDWTDEQLWNREDRFKLGQVAELEMDYYAECLHCSRVHTHCIVDTDFNWPRPKDLKEYYTEKDWWLVLAPVHY